MFKTILAYIFIILMIGDALAGIKEQITQLFKRLFDNANIGNTIIVDSRIYYENINKYYGKLSKDLSLEVEYW